MMAALFATQSKGDPRSGTQAGAAPKGRGLDAAWIAGITLFSLLVLLSHLDLTVRRTDRALYTFDSAEYAIAGRNLSDTGRLTTPFSYPILLRVAGHPPFALLAGHPLVPMLNALVFRLGGARAALTLIPPGVSYLFTVVIAALLAMHVCGSRAAASAAAIGVALTPGILYFASEGLSEMPFAALFLMAVLTLARLHDAPRPFWLGVCLGLAHLARPVVAPLLPAWLLGAAAIAPPGRRLRTVALVLAGFVPLAAALAIYKMALSGSADPGGVWLLTDLTPEFSIVRLARLLTPPAPLPILLGHPAAVLVKVLHYGPRLLLESLTGGGTVLGLLFLVYLVTPAEPKRRRFHLTLAGLLVLLVALVALTIPRQAYLFPFTPLAVALGIAEAHRLARALRFPARIVAAIPLALALVLCGVPTARQWIRAHRLGERDRGVFTETEMRHLGATLGQRLPPGATIASDMSPWFSWYAHLTGTLLPISPGDLAPLERLLPLNALVITNEWLIDLPGQERWRDLYLGGSAPGWVHAGWVESGRARAALLLPAHAGGPGRSPVPPERAPSFAKPH